MEPGYIYHIFNRSINKELLFKEEANCHFFLKRLQDYLGEHISLYAYCLMPDHFHLLAGIKDFEAPTLPPPGQQRQLSPVEKGFKDFFISYAKAVNNRYRRTGSLFQVGYKHKHVDKDSYFANAIAYIHYNPVAARLCPGLLDWPFSSFSAFRYGLDPLPMLDRQFPLDWFGGLKPFLAFHENYRAYRATRDYLGLSDWDKGELP